jgi:N-methylhydantoinase A
MQADRIAAAGVTILRSVEVRYVGQSYELEVPISEPLDAAVIGRIEAAFHARHERVYGHSHPGGEVELVNLRAVFLAPL